MAASAQKTQVDRNAQKTQVDKNYEEFRRALPELLTTAPGKYVVLHDGSISETFDTFADAVRFGQAKFGANKYSVQEVTTKQISLGCHSYALRSNPD